MGAVIAAHAQCETCTLQSSYLLSNIFVITGSPSITSVLLDRNSTTLTCISTGGPPTTVSWRKDGQPINETLYEQSQRLVNTETANYENILSSNTIANFVGSFTCEVSNARGSDTQTMELNGERNTHCSLIFVTFFSQRQVYAIIICMHAGVTIVRDQFSVGSSAMVRCSSDNLATGMEWLNNELVIARASSIQELDLMFSLVNDSIHNQVYVCRVTRDGGNGTIATAMQNFTVNVAGKIILLKLMKSLNVFLHSTQYPQLPSVPL